MDILNLNRAVWSWRKFPSSSQQHCLTNDFTFKGISCKVKLNGEIPLYTNELQSNPNQAFGLKMKFIGAVHDSIEVFRWFIAA